MVKLTKGNFFCAKTIIKKTVVQQSKAKPCLFSLFMDHFSSIPWPGAKTTFRYSELRWLVTLYKKTIDIWAFFLLNSLLFLLSFSDVYQSTAGKICCSAHGYFCEDVIGFFFSSMAVRRNSKQKVEFSVFSGRSFILHIPWGSKSSKQSILGFDLRENVWFC